MRHIARTVCVTLFAVATVVGAAGARPSQVDVELNVGASLILTSRTLVPNGGSVTVTRREFFVHVDVSLITAAPGGRMTIRAELGDGLRWGDDSPDPTEDCTSTASVGECETPDLQPVTGQTEGGWSWNVIAPGNGSYSFSAAIVKAPHPDPVSSNDASRITIVVNEPSSAPPGGGGGGGTAAATASSAKLAPAKPKAGSTVVASVRVSREGSPVRPTGVRCSATVAGSKLKGVAKTAPGVASCSFRTAQRAKGKTLAGSVSFRAGGKAFTKRFSTRLA
ncbi:MAG TPA: hypothetical protein VFO64_00125 [Gaiellaceae bacterium]|nr:hypothetical protein [Gaiellaceae bacterium]